VPINLVTEQEIKELEKKLEVTDKKSLEYRSIETKLTYLREELDSQKRLVKKAGKKGYRPNPTDGHCAATGERIKANAGFAKKDHFGRWEVFSWDIVKEEIG
jgi:hypothetical protein